MSLLWSEERISLSFDSLIPVWLRRCGSVVNNRGDEETLENAGPFFLNFTRYQVKAILGSIERGEVKCKGN
jgi:hypothetical protein